VIFDEVINPHLFFRFDSEEFDPVPELNHLARRPNAEHPAVEVLEIDGVEEDNEERFIPEQGNIKSVRSTSTCLCLIGKLVNDMFLKKSKFPKLFNLLEDHLIWQPVLVSFKVL
jgi:hypothetical protein